jgi:hypothetical protein
LSEKENEEEEDAVKSSIWGFSVCGWSGETTRGEGGKLLFIAIGRVNL